MVTSLLDQKLGPTSAGPCRLLERLKLAAHDVRVHITGAVHGPNAAAQVHDKMDLHSGPRDANKEPW